MHKIVVNGVEIFPFSSEAQLLNYVNERKGILIAINAEKILNATKETRYIINGILVIVTVLVHDGFETERI